MNHKIQFLRILWFLSSLLCALSLAKNIDKPPLQLANVYSLKHTSSQDLAQKSTKSVKSSVSNIVVSDYWVSEKLDGVRAYWNGSQLLTRQGYPINPPNWFIRTLGTEPLDGELWIKRDNFDYTSGLIRSNTPNHEDWRHIKFMIFDLPSHKGIFGERIVAMQKKILEINAPWVKMIPQIKIATESELNDYLSKIVKQGAEGLMLHKNSAYYQEGRTNNLLKLKIAHDQEGTVISYIEGKGKYVGMMGALMLKLDNGIHFKLGSGFKDEMRRNPPKIGTRITFKYDGLTKKGVPKFARFMRIRVDE